MIKREKGFSLVELLIVMLVLGVVLAASSETFISLLRIYKQQSMISGSYIEGIIGLEMLRRDIQSAGYGLPWVIPAGTTYQEAADDPDDYNDSPAFAPRALLSGLDTGGTAHLVLKATNLGISDVCAKYTNLLTSESTTVRTIWNRPIDNMDDDDRVIVLSPGVQGATNDTRKTLVGPTGANLGPLLQLSGVSALRDSNETRIIYGVAPADGANPLRMPFNRADYYVGVPAGSMPGRCAQGTGILYKAVLNHSDGELGEPLPLLDCVADFQVVTHLTGNVTSNGLIVPASSTAAATIRNQLQEVHIFILTHEGQRDPSYTHPSNSILVGESATRGRIIDLTTLGDPNWQNYRWKVYTLTAKAYNVR